MVILGLSEHWEGSFAILQALHPRLGLERPKWADDSGITYSYRRRYYMAHQQPPTKSIALLDELLPTSCKMHNMEMMITFSEKMFGHARSWYEHIKTP